jgi:hypothetical protein
MNAIFSENRFIGLGLLCRERHMKGAILIHVPQSYESLEVTFLKIVGYIQMAYNCKCTERTLRTVWG